MPATILCEPVSVPVKAGVGNDVDEIFKTLRETFGAAPTHQCVEIGPNYLFTLRALGGYDSIFDKLATLIEKNGRMRIWIEG